MALLSESDQTEPTAQTAAATVGHVDDDPVVPHEKRRVQIFFVAILLAVYAALSTYSSSVPSARGLGVVISLGPVLLIAGILLWRWTRALIATLATALCGVLLSRYWGFLERNFEWADMVQQCAAYGLIALAFLRTLFGGREPLCAQWAVQLHGELVPAEVVYARRATVVWGAFYILLVAAILVLFFTVSRPLWSMLVNFATFGLIAVLCVLDVALRRWLLPRRPAGGLLSSLRQALMG